MSKHLKQAVQLFQYPKNKLFSSLAPPLLNAPTFIQPCHFDKIDKY